MTNQQAIDLLSHTYFPCGSDSGEAIAKAIEALKAQEAVEPTWRLGVPFCSKCGRQFKRGYKYCPDCGKAVKWE